MLLGGSANLYDDPILAWQIKFIRDSLAQRCTHERWVRSLIAFARKAKGHMDAGSARYHAAVCFF